MRESGDWESWLRFLLSGVTQVAGEATDIARRILRMREEHRELIRKHVKGTSNALLLLDRLFQRPILSVPLTAELIGVTFPTAANLLNKLSELGLLHETTGSPRNRLFAYDPYLGLFEPHAAQPQLADNAGLIDRTRDNEK